jgi:hypothetical protein
LVEEWDSLEEYAQCCRIGAYQLKDAVDGLELRVKVGRLGFVRTFKNAEDPLFNRILSFCNLRGFYKIQGHVDDELFFT